MINKNVMVGIALSALISVNSAFAAKTAPVAAVTQTVQKLTVAETKAVVLKALATPSARVDAKTLQALGINEAAFTAGVRGLLSSLGVASSTALTAAQATALDAQVSALVSRFQDNATSLFAQLPGIDQAVLKAEGAVQGVAANNMNVSMQNAAPVARTSGSALVDAIAYLEANAGTDAVAQTTLTTLKRIQSSAVANSLTVSARKALELFLPVALNVTPTTVDASKAVKATVDAICGVVVSVEKNITTEAKAGAFLVSVLNGLLAHESAIGNDALVAGYKNVVVSMDSGTTTEAASCVLGQRNEFSAAQNASFCSQYNLCM